MTLAKVSLALFLACALIGSAALAGPPLEGVYTSSDLGGPLQVGRYMETFLASGGALLAGTTLHAQSWDGMDLGLQWSYQCGVMVSDPVLIVDMVGATGTGSRTYMKSFVGGTIWLSGTGPWGNGETEYAGPILDYVEYETIQYVNWVRTHAVSNVSATAQIEGFSESCVAFSVGNGVEMGSTDFGDPIPTDYPVMLDENCDPTVALGSWWDLMTISMYIDDCVVSSDPTTWDTIKSFYR